MEEISLRAHQNAQQHGHHLFAEKHKAYLKGERLQCEKVFTQLWHLQRIEEWQKHLAAYHKKSDTVLIGQL